MEARCVLKMRGATGPRGCRPCLPGLRLDPRPPSARTRTDMIPTSIAGTSWRGAAQNGVAGHYKCQSSRYF